jgi:hypothetical protein
MTIEACGTCGELRSQTFTVNPESRHIVAPDPDLPARFLASVCEELTRMLLDQVCIHDPDPIVIEGEMDCEVSNQSGFPASALLARYCKH